MPGDEVDFSASRGNRARPRRFGLNAPADEPEKPSEPAGEAPADEPVEPRVAEAPQAREQGRPEKEPESSVDVDHVRDGDKAAVDRPAEKSPAEPQRNRNSGKTGKASNASKRRSTGNTRPARSAGNSGRAGSSAGVEYSVGYQIVDPREKREQDWGYMPESLNQELARAKLMWSLNHPDWMLQAGGEPSVSGFKEALIRLGLKHLDDDELGDLIPPDQRRRKQRTLRDDELEG